MDICILSQMRIRVHHSERVRKVCWSLLPLSEVRNMSNIIRTHIDIQQADFTPKGVMFVNICLLILRLSGLIENNGVLGADKTFDRISHRSTRSSSSNSRTVHS